MGYRLHEDLSFGIRNDRVFFLDARRDRYFCLPHHLNDAFLAAAAASDNQHRDVAGWLIDAGILVEGLGSASLHPAAVGTPDSSFVDDDEGKPSFGGVLHALTAQVATAVALRRRNLADVVLALKRRKAGARVGGAEADFEAVLRGFRASGEFLSGNDRCLMKSVSLARVLASRSPGPSLVFGVKDNPFGAHCWVQNGSRILNDSLDRAMSFTPVMVV